jgi:hypothetical protein
MHGRRLSIALLLLAVLPLQGCEQFPRPNRTLTYEIKATTSDGMAVSFSGSTVCEYRVNLHAHPRYVTRSRRAFASEHGSNWMLDGIDCHNEIADKGPRHYSLYRTINEKQGKIYYVMDGGAARITEARLTSSIWGRSKPQGSDEERYPDGPYLYQKVFLANHPPSVGSQSDPVVVFAGNNICGRHNKEGVGLTEKDFGEDFRRGLGIVAIEEGVLVFENEHNAWTPRADVDLSQPLDVAARPPYELPVGCVKVRLAGRTFVMHQYSVGTRVYVPSEKAFYLVRKIWVGHALAHVNDQRSWKACPAPKDDIPARPGTVYRVGNGFGVIKRNPDDTFSCRSNFQWLATG